MRGGPQHGLKRRGVLEDPAFEQAADEPGQVGAGGDQAAAAEGVVGGVPSPEVQVEDVGVRQSPAVGLPELQVSRAQAERLQDLLAVDLVQTLAGGFFDDEPGQHVAGVGVVVALSGLECRRKPQSPLGQFTRCPDAVGAAKTSLIHDGSSVT
nr:hypothetical protein GCM10020093_022940 [Planobispora longispora]